MRRMVRSASADRLLNAAASFLNAHRGADEVLVVANTRQAADDLVRLRCRHAAGIHRATPARLAAEIATPSLAERGLAPLNRLGSEALCARAAHRLRVERGFEYFEPVCSLPGFSRALARTLTELRLAQVQAEDLRTAGPAGRDLSALQELYEQFLTQGRLADLPVILTLAVEAVDAGHRLACIPLLLLDVAVRSQLEAQFLQALCRKAPAVLALLLVSDQQTAARLAEELEFETEVADEPGQTSLEQLRSRLFTLSAAPQPERDGSFDFFSAAGEGLECTEIARRIHHLAERGITFDQVAVLLRSPERYQPLVEEAFYRAGIPYYFTHGSIRPDPGGRAFLALLACALEGFTATRFAEYLSLGEIPSQKEPRGEPATEVWIGAEDELFPEVEIGQEPDEPAPTPPAPSAWEKILVDAAVVGGRDRWERRLRGYEEELRLRLAALEEDDEAERGHLQRQIELVRSFQELALPIIDRLAALPPKAYWSEWLEYFQELAQLTLRRPGSVLLALNELWAMGEVGPVTLEEAALALSHRLRFLRRPPPRHRYGHVWVGAIEEARGLSFEAVFLPGLAEGNFPQKTFEDPLLLDHLRKDLPGGLALRDDRVEQERLRLHIAAAAARRYLVVSYPRIDVWQNRPRVPSFYAMEAVRASEGRLPDLKAFEGRAAAGARTRLGWPAPERPEEAVDELEFDLASLQQAWARPQQEARGAARYLLTVNAHLARSLRTRHQRWHRRWSAADGLISEDEQTRALLDGFRLARRAWSATALQHFAACPYRFVLHGIFQFRPREDPVALEEMDPLTRGALFHTVQFELFRRAEGDPDRMHALADQVLDEVAADFAERLAPAIPRVWSGEVEDLRADLKGWLRRALQDGSDWEAVHCEFGFGLAADDSRDPGSIVQAATILSGIQLRGSIDWVERHCVTGKLRITDHKTGKAPQKAPRHIGGGAYLQPLLYALAAENLLGKPVQESRLYYCTQRGGFESILIPVNEEAQQTLQLALDAIDQSIARTFLPAAPAAGQCVICDYKLVCGPREQERTARKETFYPLEDLRRLP